MVTTTLKKSNKSQVPVAHIYNPSYSGSRDQEYCGSKSALANRLQDHISKKLITKKCGGGGAGGVAQGVGSEFKP
jgi:hypothetical protein